MNKFKVLQRGNFYFPVGEKRKFEVINTLDIKISKEDQKLFEMYKNMEKKYKSIKQTYLNNYALIIWNALKPLTKKTKKYKNCWFVPIRLSYLGKDLYATVDVIKFQY